MLELCMCGSGSAYTQCCGCFHLHKKRPETAEQLMRSRYSAFVLQNADYLLLSWSKKTCPVSLEFESELVWQKLEIVQVQQGRAGDKMGKVHFKAHFTQGRRMDILEEISRFRREQGHWVYLDGLIL